MPRDEVVEATHTSLAAGARVGFDVPLCAFASFYPRATIGVESVHVQQAIVSGSSERSDELGAAPHFFVGFGPSARYEYGGAKNLGRETHRATVGAGLLPRRMALVGGLEVEVSNADRVVFPEIGRTKGDVVAYYERVASRALPHVVDRPLSIRRYPKGLAAAGFFQKNVPEHYPPSIERFAIPRSPEATKRHRGKGDTNRDVTVYPIVREAELLPYLANQGAIELHAPTARAPHLERPDRIVIDLDPPPDALALVRRAALVMRDAIAELGLPTVAVATGSKGYHVVAPIAPTVGADVLGAAVQKLAALVEQRHSDEMTTAFRVAKRGHRVFIDWLRNRPLATVVVPYSLRAKPRASVATPIAWSEIESTAPDAFTIADVDRLLDRPDHLADAAPHDAAPFVAAVDAAFERAGLVLEVFDRFRS